MSEPPRLTSDQLFEIRDALATELLPSKKLVTGVEIGRLLDDRHPDLHRRDRSNLIPAIGKRLQEVRLTHASRTVREAIRSATAPIEVEIDRWKTENGLNSGDNYSLTVTLLYAAALDITADLYAELFPDRDRSKLIGRQAAVALRVSSGTKTENFVVDRDILTLSFAGRPVVRATVREPIDQPTRSPSHA